MNEDIERAVAGLARDENLFVTQEHPAQKKIDVLHIVHFAHRGYYLVCHADIQLAAEHHIPHQFYDYQYLDLLSAGFQNDFTFKCIHTQFDLKVGYGEYKPLPLPKSIAVRCYGEQAVREGWVE